MKAEETALILIGFQNDYFATDGVLHQVIDGPAQLVANTVDLVERLSPSRVLIIDTPVIFTADYGELVEPVGILKMVKEAGAFKGGTQGAETIAEIRQFGERVVEVPGKRGLNAFSNTDLDHLLKKKASKTLSSPAWQHQSAWSPLGVRHTNAGTGYLFFPIARRVAPNSSSPSTARRFSHSMLK